MHSRCLAWLCLMLCGSILLAQTNPVPLVSQPLVPSGAKPGRGGFTLTVNGSGFSAGAVLYWNGSSRLTEVVSSSQLKAKIKANDVAHKGIALVTIANPGGKTSNLVLFPIRKPSTTIAMQVSQVFDGCLSVVVGDFDGDGILDVVWMGGGSGLNLSRGNGKGGFEAPISSNVDSSPYRMAIGDFNGDGRLDVAGIDYDDAAVFLQGADGTFTQSWSAYSPGANNGVAVADFNQDGKLDLYATGWDLGRQWFAIYLGTGNGKFGNGEIYDQSYFSGSAGVGDFNKDGKLDLAIPEIPDGAARIFQGDGQGNFDEIGSFLQGGAQSIAVVDMNGDGTLDLVGDQGCILLGRGDGTFTMGGCDGSAGMLVGTADFNGDGKPDAALVSGYSQMLTISLGKGDGTFGASLQFPAGTSAFSAGNIGDFDGDGRLDVILDTGFLLLQTNRGLLPASLAFGDQDVGTKSKPQTATLTNAGTSELVITSIKIPSQDFTETNNCGSRLPAGDTCNIQVTFEPKKEGQRLATLKVKYKGVGSPLTVSLGGTGIGVPVVSLTPSRLTFPVQLINTQSAPQIATLTNTGSKDVTISDISITSLFAQTNNCPPTLTSGSNCQISVTFTPDVGGDVQGELSVTDNAQGSPQKVAIFGTGTVVKFSVSGVNFGDQQVGTKSSPAAITLMNLGSQVLNISQIAFTGTNAGDFSQTNNCGNSVPVQGQCKIKVTFTPQAKGPRWASLSVSDDGGGSPQSVPLSGNGT